MGLTFNGKMPAAIQIGGKQVDNIVMNGEIVWPAQPTGPDYFYIENLYNYPSTIRITKYGTPTTGTTLEYSYDKINWNTCVYNSNGLCNISNIVDKVYFRSSDGFSTRYNYYYINCTYGKIGAGGDLRTLLDYTNDNLNTTSDYCFSSMFATTNQTYRENLIDISKIDFSKLINLTLGCYSNMFYYNRKLTSTPSILPATNLAESCYDYMFANSGIQTPPLLPATTMAKRCYAGMFLGSTLSQPPVLQSTNLAESCYSSMLSQCNKLTTVPLLPATTLVKDCYQEMFRSSKNITETPVLPATRLSSDCYYQMFDGCESLNKIYTYATSWNSSYAHYWVRNVSSTGDFYNLGGATNIPSGESGIPTNWTVHTSL